jgi:peroxiredoxin Q/BCP
MVGVGEKAADFELPAHTGEMVRLSSFRGRRVVLFFYPQGRLTGMHT